MKIRSFYVIFLALTAPVLLAGCSETFAKKSPDEFAVTRRAPLEMPPPGQAETLPVPTPGAPRPQEQDSDAAARKALTGETVTPAPVSEGAAALVEQAGAEKTDPRIRRKIDGESVDDTDSSTPVVKKLFGWAGLNNGGKGKALDAEAEAERLRKEGVQVPQKPEDGESPKIQQNDGNE